MFHSRSSVSDFTGAAAPSDASHALKSRFMPYLNDDRAVRVLAFRLVDAGADAPEQEVVAGVLVDDARDVGRIDDDRALLLEDRDRLGHHLRLIGVEAAARRSAPGGVSAS